MVGDSRARIQDARGSCQWRGRGRVDARFRRRPGRRAGRCGLRSNGRWQDLRLHQPRAGHVVPARRRRLRLRRRGRRQRGRRPEHRVRSREGDREHRVADQPGRRWHQHVLLHGGRRDAGRQAGRRGWHPGGPHRQRGHRDRQRPEPRGVRRLRLVRDGRRLRRLDGRELSGGEVRHPDRLLRLSAAARRSTRA